MGHEPVVKKGDTKILSLNDIIRNLANISLVTAVVAFTAGAILLMTNKNGNDRVLFTSGMLVGLSCAQCVMWGFLIKLGKLLRK
jgi:hypothetical protein